MNPQLDLDFSAAPAGEERLRDRLRELLAILHADGGWMTRRDLEGIGFGDRELRALSEHDAEGTIFSFPGSPGYKHFDHVSDAEFDGCAALRSQGRKMVRKWVRFQRRWHRRGKP